MKRLDESHGHPLGYCTTGMTKTMTKHASGLLAWCELRVRTALEMELIADVYARQVLRRCVNFHQ